ncbi:MAG TPA: hypothetical protein VN616_05230 [Puia sp.]|nr:hypothetical protein [Puia sp.]
MLKILLLSVPLGLAIPTLHAQQKTTHHMTITIYEDFDLGGHSELIETHEDGTQTIRKIRWAAPRNLKNQVIHEDSVMLALTPYFNTGWEVSASTETVQSGSSEYITRFFLRKE